MTSARFVIVDDHPVVAFALVQLLSAEPGWQVCGQAPTLREAEELVERVRPTAVILDLMLPGESGMEFLSWLRSERPTVRAIVYSIQPSEIYARRCLQHGASAYVGKHANVENLLESVRLVLQGQTVVCDDQIRSTPNIADVPELSDGLEELSQRELEILNLIGQGMSNIRIARLLCRSAKTIETHRYRISRKLDVPNGPELVHFAVQHRLAAETLVRVASSSTTPFSPSGEE